MLLMVFTDDTLSEALPGKELSEEVRKLFLSFQSSLQCMLLERNILQARNRILWSSWADIYLLPIADIILGVSQGLAHVPLES
jgi:hypothetical protein